MFADGRVDRGTPCRLGADGAWKTIDDLLPILKYGTQVPAPSKPARSENAPSSGAGFSALDRRNDVLSAQRISLVEIDLPFVSILKLTFKWMAAAIIVSACLFPVLMIIVFIVTAIFGSLLSGVFAGFHRP